jgi:hypothetical protein
MSETYEPFMLYELDDSGERIRLNASKEEFLADNGRNFLHPEQVLVIVKEDIRRIYIWKGAKSPVRKRFISSRVAGRLQEELVKNAAFHRCKIVSVDQGDEVVEFLNAFGFESMPVDEKLADLRYIRNVDKEKMYNQGIVPEKVPKYVKVERKPEGHISPALEELEKSKVVPLPEGTKKKAATKAAAVQKKSLSREAVRPSSHQPLSARPSYESRSQSGLSQDQKKKIMEKILKTEVPEGFKRQNLILGHRLYGAVLKKVNVLGKTITETEWEEVKTLPKDTIEIEDHNLRVYFDYENGIVEALEVLERTENSQDDREKMKNTTEPKAKDTGEESQDESPVDYSSWTVKELKKFAEENDIDLPSSARKAEIVEIVENSQTTEKSNDKTSKKRKLPDIPKG